MKRTLHQVMQNVHHMMVLSSLILIRRGLCKDLIAPVHVARELDIRRIAEAIGFEARDAGPPKKARYLKPITQQGLRFAYGLGRGARSRRSGSNERADAFEAIFTSGVPGVAPLHRFNRDRVCEEAYQ